MDGTVMICCGMTVRRVGMFVVSVTMETVALIGKGR